MYICVCLFLCIYLPISVSNYLYIHTYLPTYMLTHTYIQNFGQRPAGTQFDRGPHESPSVWPPGQPEDFSQNEGDPFNHVSFKVVKDLRGHISQGYIWGWLRL